MTGQASNEEGPGFDSSGLRAPPVPAQNEAVNAITQKLSAYLQAPQGPVSTAPAGFDEALQAIRSSEPLNSISLAFQRRGFWSWLAYFLAAKDADQFDGLFQSLSGLPLATLSDIAGHVSRASVEPSLIQRIQNTLWTAKRGNQRRSILDFPSAPSTIPSPSLESDSRKRPRAQSLDNPDDPTGVTGRPSSYNMTSDTTQTDNASTVCHPAAGQPTGELRTLDDTSRPMSNPDPRYSYAYPNASSIPSVFEPELGDMIVRNDNYTASIFVALPPDPTQCQLVLDVEAPMVVPLAMKLYGAQIVETERQRAFRLSSGASVGIIGTVKLTKTKIGLWDELLGNLAGGVRNSQMYLNEAVQGLALSKCLSIEIPGVADGPARISLTMDLFTLNDIINKLWLS
ncbi:hypothetical protein F66182_2462 [Fusarium sp. NRRL 66182]|nr:hypothetical protein F66182_2462 [Fusarium sp. NRRL 66182]